MGGAGEKEAAGKALPYGPDMRKGALPKTGNGAKAGAGPCFRAV